jgi:hypothetical protein
MKILGIKILTKRYLMIILFLDLKYVLSITIKYLLKDKNYISISLKVNVFNIQ